MDSIGFLILPLLVGWFADRALGDPVYLPHPIVWFGKIIHCGEKKLNKGNNQKIKGGCFAVLLIIAVFSITLLIQKILYSVSPYIVMPFNALVIFYCLAGKTLADEVRNVFRAVDRSLEDGRTQVARIVGRDTSELSEQQIRTAALETASENLSDGVIAPLFWFLILGVPGMLAYKMINTLDSMIGYKNERYKNFGCWAAHIDDWANYIPARLTAFLMIVTSGRLRLWSFVKRYGSCHASPNSGYPEAALAGILNCRFGGPNYYFGKKVDKHYIGINDRMLRTSDMHTALNINSRSETLMIVLTVCFIILIHWIL